VSESTVDYLHAGSVAWLRLNRPHRLNAVTPTLVDDLLAGFDRAEAEGARVVVLAGHGRAFCAGYDLKDFTPDASVEAARNRLQRLQDVTRRTLAFPGPVVAAVQGYALGAGVEFALACDIVVAGADAVFGFPEVAVGLSSTNGASALLPRLVGPLRAKELVLLGERIDAERAQEIGLVTRVVPAGSHIEAADAIAQSLIARPAHALRLAKRLLDSGIESSVAEALDAEVEAALMTLDTGEIDAATARFRAGE
jgi:2-(1,2-epoxy-1,2-dihydrophenyl)acetyl-CoA isomerase